MGPIDEGNAEHQAIYEFYESGKPIPISWDEAIELWVREKSRSNSSLDASLLALTFNNVENGFSAIHDSILTHANDMDKAITRLKESYTTIFKDRIFLQYLQNDVLLSVSPLVTDEATFDSSEVMESEFFFS